MDKRNSHFSTFSGGMDRDTNFANLPKEKYYELKNGRVVINNYSNSLSITPYKQPSLKIELLESTDVIIGSILARNGESFYLILFSKHSTYTDKDKIYLLDLQTNTLTKKYEGILGFSLQYLVDGISKYESDVNIKIYWWDNLNPFRYCNIASTISSFLPTQFDSLPNIQCEQPILSNIGTNGSLKSGKIQYCYRLYNSGGSQGSISPFSGMIHLTGSGISELSQTANNYLGSPNQDTITATTATATETENTGKSVTITCNNLDTTFNKIILYSIHYTTASSSPVCKKLYDGYFPGSSFTFVDTGNVSGSSVASIDDILFENFLPYPKTGLSKHNSLYFGNIKKKQFNVDVDFRAYRYPENSAVTSVKEANGNSTAVNNTFVVASDSDCIQRKSEQYYGAKAYKKNSEDLGGTGKYIEYDFFIKQVLIDADPIESALFDVPSGSDNWDDLNDTQVSNNYPTNTSFTDYNSPYIDYSLGGYQRDEVYAFAIVFRNNKGQKSFPIWIADIKMPAVHETQTSTTYGEETDFNITQLVGDKGAKQLYGNILGIRFTLDYYNLMEDYPALFGLRSVGAERPIIGWEIVRMARTNEDKSIISQGLYAKLTVNSNGYYYFNENSNNGAVKSTQTYQPLDGVKDTVCAFITPEYYLGLNLNSPYTYTFKNGDYMKFSHKIASNIFGTQPSFVHKFADTQVDAMRSQLPGKTVKSNASLQCYQFSPLGAGVTVHPFFNPGGGNNWRGSALGIALDGTDFADYSSQTTNPVWDYFVMNYCRNIEDTAYGGNTYFSRFTRTYISTVNYTLFGDVPAVLGDANSDKSLNVLGGDTYISFFDNLSKMFGYIPQNTNNSGEYSWLNRDQSITMFPVESSINLNLRHGRFFSKQRINEVDVYDYSYAHNPPNNPIDLIKVYMEKGGIYADIDTTTLVSTTMVQRTDYYLYNTVYSQYPIYPVYIPKPQDFNSQDIFDARIIYSDTKISGESTDSWLIFRPLNFKDLDYEHGPINQLVKFKDNVFSLQTKALSLISINPRVALSTDNGLPIQMGSGGKLERFDYITTKYGSFHRFSAIASDTGLYYFDAFNKKIMCYMGENVPLTDLKGMYSYINKDLAALEYSPGVPLFNVDKGVLSQISSSYDRINNEILFNFNIGTASYYIAYNELMKSFSSIYTFASGINGGEFLCNSNKGLFVLRNNRVYTYDAEYSTSMPTELSVIVNSDYNVRKVFDNLFFDIDIYYPESNKDINYVQTKYTNHTSPKTIVNAIDYIKFYNDFQNSGNVIPKFRESLAQIVDKTYNLSKVEREYMFKIGPNQVVDPALSILDIDGSQSSNLYSPFGSVTTNIPTFKDRMKGKYVICKIKLKCFNDVVPTNKELRVFALNYLNTLYRPSF